MGLIRKAIFLGTAATGTPLVRWNSSQEAAAKEQRRLLQEQNEILSDLVASQHAAQFDDMEEDIDDYEGSAPSVSSVATAIPAAGPSLTDRLLEAKQLLDEGVITAEEHAAMKRKILGV